MFLYQLKLFQLLEARLLGLGMLIEGVWLCYVPEMSKMSHALSFPHLQLVLCLLTLTHPSVLFYFLFC